MKQLFLSACCILFLAHSFCQQPGTLDKSFGDEGKIITEFEDGSFAASAGAIQAGGRIIVAGVFGYNNDEDFISYPALAAFNLSGITDTAFASNGKSVVLPPGFYYAVFNAVAVQGDGKIIAVGYGRNISSFTLDMVIGRYNINGTLDSSFGENGWVTTDLTMNEFANAVSVQEDGKIAVSGFWLEDDEFSLGRQFLTARYLPNGRLDNSFGGNGVVLTHFLDYVDRDQANAIAVQKDGKIISAGATRYDLSDRFAIARYNTDGTLDASFGINGRVTTDFGDNGELITSIIIQSDGKLIACGSSSYGNKGIANLNVALARYNTDGTLDKTFGNEGKLVTNIPKNSSQGNSVILQKNNKILVGGFTVVSGTDPEDFLLARYNENGTPDTSFGANGITVTDIGYSDIAYSLSLQQDGKIIAIGNTYDELTPFGFTGIALARYYGDPVKQYGPIAKKIKRWIRNHTLQWQPVNDNDVSYYSIQQSSNGVNGFKEIGRIAASNKPQTASNVYSFSLNNASAQSSQLTAQGSNYYRITAVSNTGSNITSEVIADESSSSITISPNPVKDVMKISGLPANQKTTINIVNRNGNILQSAICNSSICNLNVSQLKSGVYNVQVISNSNTQTVKIIKE